MGHIFSNAARDVAIYDRSGSELQREIRAAIAVPRPANGDWLLRDVRIRSIKIKAGRMRVGYAAEHA